MYSVLCSCINSTMSYNVVHVDKDNVLSCWIRVSLIKVQMYQVPVIGFNYMYTMVNAYNYIE